MKFPAIVILGAVLWLVGCALPINVARLIEQSSNVTTQDLVGDWRFRMVSDSDSVQAQWMVASVPGTVYADLMAAGDKDWEYELVFTVSKDMLAQRVQELVFNGLDTCANVHLNDSLLLVSDSMFVEWRVSVNGILRKDQNRLNIKFKNTYKMRLEALEKHNVRGEEKVSNSTRKASDNFGWNWSPRLLAFGVWRPVFVECWSTARIADVQFIQTSQSEALATFDAHVRIASASWGSSINVVLADSSGVMYANETIDLESVGDTVVKLNFRIQNPKLWRPNGAGQANIYPVYTILANKDNLEKLDQRIEKIEVRTESLVQQKDSVGEGQFR